MELMQPNFVMEREPEVLAAMEDLLEKKYPNLFDRLNQVYESLLAIKEQVKVELLFAIHDNLNIKLEDLFRREKLVLFPFLKAWIRNPQIQQSPIPPINTVFQQFNKIISELKAFQQNLFQFIAQNKDYEDLDNLSKMIHVFESDCKVMQHYKVHHIFVHFGFQAESI